MAATETAIANLALMRLGHELIADIDGGEVLEEKCAVYYDQVRDELLAEGPLLGWKFAKTTYHGIDAHSATVSSIAVLVAGSTITVTTSASHGLVAGDMVELDGDTGYDDTYDVISVVDTSPTFTFAVAATFVATGTGTAHWRSESYAYRYAIPTSKKVIAAKVGGIELPDWLKRGAYVLTNMESEEVDIDIVQSITTVTLFPDHFVRVLSLKLAIELAYNITQDMKIVDKLDLALDVALPKAIAVDERQKYVQESSESWQEVGNTQEID